MALTTHALTTLATVKSELGVTGTDDDAYLERLINSVSDAFRRVCKRDFSYAAGVVEKLTGTGRRLLFLRRYPVVSVTTVEETEEVLDVWDPVTEDGDYELDAETGALIRTEANWEAPPSAHLKNIEVTYTGGYVTPSQVAGELVRDLPHDLEDLCIQAVTARYSQRGADLSIVREQLLSASYTYDRESGLPVAVRVELERKYKRSW